MSWCHDNNYNSDRGTCVLVSSQQLHLRQRYVCPGVITTVTSQTEVRVSWCHHNNYISDRGTCVLVSSQQLHLRQRYVCPGVITTITTQTEVRVSWCHHNNYNSDRGTCVLVSSQQLQLRQRYARSWWQSHRAWCHHNNYNSDTCQRTVPETYDFISHNSARNGRSRESESALKSMLAWF